MEYSEEELCEVKDQALQDVKDAYVPRERRAEFQDLILDMTDPEEIYSATQAFIAQHS